MSTESCLRAAICSVALLFALPVVAAPEIQQWTTDNGARVLFVPAPEIPMVDARVTFAAGSARDGAHPGIARMTSDLLLSGTEQLDADALALTLEREGAEVSTGAARDMAWLELRSLSEGDHLDTVVSTAASVLARPAFSAAEVERIRAQQRTSIRNKAQSPGDIARDRFWSEVYGEHPYGHDPLGTTDSLADIDQRELRRFHQRHYVAANANVAIVGDLDRARAQRLANTLVGELPRGKPAPELPPTPDLVDDVTVRIPFPSSQAHVIAGRRGVERGYAHWPSLYVANHVFGGGGFTSRLYQQVREERGLVYSVYSYFSPMAARGPFVIGLQTRGDQIGEALSIVERELERFRSEGPASDAVADAIRNIDGGFPLRVDSNQELAGYLSMMGFYGLPTHYITRFRERIRAVDAPGAHAAFRDIVGDRPMVTVIVGGGQGGNGEGAQ